MVTGVNLGYDTNASAMEMANTIFGDGVTVVGASYSGDKQSSAIYSKEDEVAGNVTPGDTGVIFSNSVAPKEAGGSVVSRLRVDLHALWIGWPSSSVGPGVSF